MVANWMAANVHSYSLDALENELNKCDEFIEIISHEIFIAESDVGLLASLQILGQNLEHKIAERKMVRFDFEILTHEK